MEKGRVNIGTILKSGRLQKEFARAIFKYGFLFGNRLKLWKI
jgi:hypothetical protein